jgi:thymidine kinase
MKVVLVTGPMFSGKTRTIIRKADNRPNSIVVKPAIDVRNNNSTLVNSHDGLVVDAISASNLMDIQSTLMSYEYVFIDEGQFFPDLCAFVRSVDAKVTKIYVSGLDYDFRCNEFEQIAELIPLCTKVIRRTSVCYKCGGIAKYSKLIQEPKNIESNILIGGSDTYSPACHNCM